MSNLVIFPNQRKAREEASLWLTRLDRELTATEREELTDWLAGSPAHGQALIQMAESWDELDILSELSEVFPLDMQSRGYRWQRPSRLVAGLAAAASIAAVVWLTMLVAPSSFEDVAATDTRVAGRAYETAVGETSTARLPDGSVVTLNTNSLIEVVYTPTERTIFLLRGEGLFEVTPNSSRPFVVGAGDQVIRAVGTAFNIELSSAKAVEVTVTEGTVMVGTMLQPGTNSIRVDPERALTTLVAGESTVVDENTRMTVQSVSDQELGSRLAWQRGMLVFQGEPLEAVMAEFERYTTAQFEIAEEIRDVPVGAYYPAGDVELLLIGLNKTFAIKSVRTGNNKILLTAQ